MEAREYATRAGMRLERLLDGLIFAEVGHGSHCSR
jgi:hypothetical protein